MARALDTAGGASWEYVWHRTTDIDKYDAIVLPGGFSYGDYLRAGAIARFSRVMDAVKNFADSGGTVIGICNGFQILCEIGLLPGILTVNQNCQFRCQQVHLAVKNRDTPFTRHIPVEKSVLRIPISHFEGNYQAPPDVLRDLEQQNRIVFQYADADGAVTDAANPNGSALNIAGIVSERGNVLGMMPHPERAYAERVGTADGNYIFNSISDLAGLAA